MNPVTDLAAENKFALCVVLRTNAEIIIELIQSKTLKCVFVKKKRRKKTTGVRTGEFPTGIYRSVGGIIMVVIF